MRLAGHTPHAHLPFRENEFSMTNDQLNAMRRRYAELLVKTGVNLQPGQGLLVRGELAHAPFVREVVAAAYDAGAVYVQVDWVCLLYTSPSPRDRTRYRMPSSA